MYILHSSWLLKLVNHWFNWFIGFLLQHFSTATTVMELIFLEKYFNNSCIVEILENYIQAAKVSSN